MKNLLNRFRHNSPAQILFLTTTLAVLHATLGIASWKFATTGDDWRFYTFALAIIESNFMINPFSMQGVFENAVLGSYYQALFMQILGTTNEAWRLSNIILIIPISIFFYLWVRSWFTQQIALLSTFFLQCSFFIANYLKMGYINAQAFTLFVISLYIASQCTLTQKRRYYLLLGLILGISFYIYLGPIFPVLLLPFLVTIDWQKQKKKVLFTNIMLLLFTYGITIAPGIADPTFFDDAGKKTIVTREFEDNIQILRNIFHNFLLFYNNFDYAYNHFIAGPYFDRVTQFFVLIGTGIVLLFSFKKKKSYALLLGLYLTLCIVWGLISPYAYTPTTRGIFFIPFGAAFAGIALALLSQAYRLSHVFLVSFFIMLFLFNVYKSQISVFEQAGHSATALIIKTLQEAPPDQPMLLYLTLDNPYNARFLTTILSAYGLDSRNIITVRAPDVSCDQLSADHIIFFEVDREIMQELPCYESSQKRFIRLTPTYWH